MIRKVFICLIAVVAAVVFSGCENRIKILKRAQEYRDKDDLEAAIEEYERLIDTYDDEQDTGVLGLAEAYFAIGEINHQMGRKDAAEEYYLKAVEHYPNYYKPLYGLGVIANEREDYAAAEQYLLRANEVFAFNTDARRLLAQIQWAQVKRMEEELIKLAKAGDREKVREFQLKRGEKLRSARENWMLLAQFRLDPALMKLLTESQLRDPEVFKTLGKVFEETNNWSDAAQVYRQAYKLSNPRDIESAYGMMKSLINARRLNDALAAAEQVEKAFPDESEPHIIRGRVHATVGEYDKAREEYALALEKADAAERLDVLYDLVRIESLEENFDTAIATLKDIEQKHPGELRTSLFLSDVYQLQKKYDLALEQVETYLEERPLDIGAKTRRGYLLGISGNVQAGVEYIEGIIEEYPQAPELSLTVARIYAQRGDIDSAFKWIEEAVDKGLANLVVFLTDDNFQKILQDKRFSPLVRRVQQNYKQQQQDYRSRSLRLPGTEPAEAESIQPAPTGSLVEGQ